MSIINWLAERTIPEPNSGCLLWLGCQSDGYGFALDPIIRKVDRAHRIVFRHLCGAIPDGMCVCHRCDVRSCCNPDHLFLGSNHDNVLDSVRKKRRARQDGMHNGNAKLSAAQVATIRTEAGSQQEIADRYGVSQMLISKIKRRELWN